MKIAPVPLDEDERIKDLRRYSILDTPGEAQFDEITRIAAFICNAEMALVSLVDESRQWFKSKHGLDAQETPRDVSFCGHAIMGSDLFIVEDAKEDDRFCDNPLTLSGPRIKFYAGAPLVTPRGHRIGTLCVLDREAKTLTETQRALLKSLANQVIDLFELRIKNAELSKMLEEKNAMNLRLQELEQRNRYIYSQSADAIVFYSPPGPGFSSVNPAAVKLFGARSEEELCALGPVALSPEFQDDGEPSRTKAKLMIQLALENGGHLFEWKHRKVDGTVIDCSVLLSRISEGDNVFLKSVIRDITEEKQSSEELERSKKEIQTSNYYLDLALETGNLGTWDWDLSDRMIRLDRRCCKMLGFRYETVLELHEWISRIHPDDRSQRYMAFLQFLENKSEIYESIHRVKHENGSWVYIVERGKYSDWDEYKKPIRFTGVLFDISKQKKLESELLEAQAISKIGSWTYNLKTKEQTWSSEHYKIFEIAEPQPTDELFSLYLERIHPDDVTELKRLLERAQVYGEDFIFNHRVLLDSGSRIKHVQGIAKVSLDSEGHPEFLSGTCQDRTRDVEMEDGHRALIETMNEGIIVYNSDYSIRRFNTAALRILCMKQEDLLMFDPRQSFENVIKLDGSVFPSDQYPVNVAMRTGNSVHDVIIGLKVLDDDTRWMRMSAVPLDRNSGRIVYISFTDITDLVRANEENKFIMESLGIGMWKFIPGTQSVFWDRAMFNLYGIRPLDLLDNKDAWMDLLTPESKAQVLVNMRKIGKEADEVNSTHEIITPKGERKFIKTRAKVIRNHSNKVQMILGINWDLTKETELENELQLERAKVLHNAKLASIGHLAAGVGHEINNPLAIIAGQASIALKLVSAAGVTDENIFERFRRIDSSVERIANIVKGLRAFARSDDNKLGEFDISDLIQETFGMLKELYLRENVTILCQPIEDQYLVTGNRGRVQQLLVNLISNAKDATESREERIIHIRTSFANGGFSFSVTDNGHGIPDEIREKIFEPFFTTKEVGKGTGIGLSLVSTILKEHDGKLAIDSKLGEGTTFTISLKGRKNTAMDKMENKSNIEERKEMKRLKILVVDDEDDLREIIAIKLSPYANVIEVADSGIRALEILGQQRFDLIVSDVKMPGMDGIELLKNIRKDPTFGQPKFIFITGGVELDRVQERLVNLESSGFLSKPFKDEQIARKILELFPDSTMKK